MSVFHAKDGWFFQRLAGGSVLIQKQEPRLNPSRYAVVAEVELDDATWASIVASVSAAGESGPTWGAALALHNDSGDRQP